MKIVKIEDERILFSDGSELTYNHYQDCCENNYAHFEYLTLKEVAKVEFAHDLIFEPVNGSGFRFGSVGTQMYFIPCYSDQNGYYSSDINIFFRDRVVIDSLEAELCIEC